MFAVPQSEAQQSTEFKFHRAGVLTTVVSSCQAVLLLLARPCADHARPARPSRRASRQNSRRDSSRRGTPRMSGGDALGHSMGAALEAAPPPDGVYEQLAAALCPLALGRAWCLYEAGLAM